MAELKTKRQKGGVREFLAGISDERVRADCQVLTKIMQDITGQPGDMWGSSIVGFGQRHLAYASGRELDWFIVGFSPRKANLTLYLGIDPNEVKDELSKLGPHSHGKGCLYIKRLSDVDVDVLKIVLKKSVLKI